MTRLVLFDLYGTLLHADMPIYPSPEAVAGVLARDARYAKIAQPLTERLIERVAEEVTRSPGLEQAPTIDVIQDCCRAVGAPFDKKSVLELMWRLLTPPNVGAVEPAEGAEVLLRELSSRGHELRVLSNCLLPRPLVERQLHEARLLPWLTQLHLSSEGGPRKPDLAAFVIAAAPYEDCVMVGDVPDLDLAPAAELGWRTVLVGDGWMNCVRQAVT